jgi:drug/metabolite transporter (DMT)-like permease
MCWAWRDAVQPGDLLVLAAGLCWAVYTLGLRTLLPGLDAW